MTGGGRIAPALPPTEGKAGPEAHHSGGHPNAVRDAAAAGDLTAAWVALDALGRLLSLPGSWT